MAGALVRNDYSFGGWEGIYARINLFYTEVGNLLHSVQQHTISFSSEEMGMLPA